MNRPLIIVGASTRAAAQSAIRAGFDPWLADMFADADLAPCGPVRQIEPYPHGLIDIFREAPDAPWMYTGALENYPDLVEQLASLRPLWGNSAETLRQVRDPMKLAAVLNNAGFQTPQVRTSLEAPSDAGGWLRKLTHSAGGRNISISETASGSAGEAALGSTKGVYFQQRINGQPISAVYVADKSGTKLLGITTQLIGNDGSGQFWNTADWTGAKNFWYAGSVGPLTESEWQVRTPEEIAGDCPNFALSAEQNAAQNGTVPLSEGISSDALKQAVKIGQCVAGEFGLIGLFGIDVILTDDELWPLEVNPRYTASIEVIERATGISAIEWHAGACGEKQKAEGRRQNFAVQSGRVHGKAVLYATHDFQVPQSFSTWAADINANSAWPTVADIPHASSNIPAGFPICTVFSEGTNAAHCIETLKQRAKLCLQTLSPWERAG